MNFTSAKAKRARLKTLGTIGDSLKWVPHLIHIVQIEANLEGGFKEEPSA